MAARSDQWTHTNHQMDVALQHAASSVPGAQYLDILGPVTNGGRYADFVNVNGQPTLVRAQDGIHFSVAGSAIVADEVVSFLKRKWHLGQKSATAGHTKPKPSGRSAT